MLHFSLMTLATAHAEPPPAESALMHLAKAFEAGVARCPLAEVQWPEGAKPVLEGFPLVQKGDDLLALAHMDRHHQVSLSESQSLLHLEWSRVEAGQVGACTARVGPAEKPDVGGGATLTGMRVLDANGDVVPMSKVQIHSEAGVDYGAVGAQFDRALGDAALPDDQRAIIVAWQDGWSI